MKKKKLIVREKKAHEAKKMYEVADSLIECLYINSMELANTGNSL